MADAGDPLFQDQFSCPICLDLLKDPVAIPCGHSYCMGCIKGYWDQDDQRRVYICPQCRQTFTPRPVLCRNTLIAEMVEKMKTGLQAAPSAQCYAGPGDVECDVCTGRKHKAVKSCLQCLASYCEAHLQPHYGSPALKKHKLVKASTQLQEKICSHHDKILDIFCRTDQKCICYLCMLDEHSGHKTVSAAAERTEKQHSAQVAVEDSERIFTELIRSIERKHSEVKEVTRAQGKVELSRAKGHLERLEQEIAELRRGDTDLKQLSHIEDHVHFLKSFQSLCGPPGSENLQSIIVSPHFSFGVVRKFVSELKEQIEYFCGEELGKLSGKATNAWIIPSAELTYTKHLDILIKKGQMGFGFRILGGQDTGVPVCINAIVPLGAAEKDGRLRVGDELMSIDGVTVKGKYHMQVVDMLANTAHNGLALLSVCRKETRDVLEDEL